jgi:chromatin remodeling complex protein RSC6
MAKKSAKSAKSARGAKSAKSAKSARGAGRTGAAKKSARKSTKSAKSTRGGSSSRGAGRKSAKGARKGGSRRPNAAFMAPVTPSSALAEVIGAQPMPRTEITKRLWAYIKKNGLQDQKNKRMIKADAALKPVFGGKNQVNMFEMTSLVNKQLS